MTFELHQGDCLEVMRTLRAASVDAIVTDPPYHLTTGKKGGSGPASVNLESPYGRARITTGFMGQAWDGGDVAFRPEVWAQALRVLKPGGQMLAFSGTRTYHRMVCAIEDAGFEIRDQLAWVYGSGFPKSHNGEWGGTALKPAWEPIVLARKPLIGTVEANWLVYGTGGLNISGCRVATEESSNGGAYAATRKASTSPWAESGSLHKTTGGEFVQPAGRWPANILHDGSDEVLAAFPVSKDGVAVQRNGGGQNVYGVMRREGEASADSDNEGAVGFKMKPGARRLDTGSAARFFYCAKASKKDRDAGLDGFTPATTSDGREKPADNAYQRGKTERSNAHPTVKPTDLMRYLCRLITPPGGLVLDPFTGSGSTGKAAVLEGFRFIGIDMQAEYLAIAQARIAHAAFGDLA